MGSSFQEGMREGFRVAFPQSIGLIPWALVTGVAMTSAGFTLLQAMGMNVIVFAGVAQLGTLPLIVAKAPLWLIITTALVLNLRFFIFSAAIAHGFRGIGIGTRWMSSYLLIDGVFAACLEKMITHEDSKWRLGYYLAPSLWSWILWQIFALVGVLAAGSIPNSWSLEFMATIALIVILLPMAKVRPMLISAITGGCMAVLLRDLPLRLGIIVAILLGIAAGFLAEHFGPKKEST
ncbi:MAG: AzlC family ABC transporter permease [Burkholderiaceae bacterium]